MSENPTQPAPNADTAQRNGYMAALSLAEQIMSEAPVLPTDFEVSVRRWAPDEPELRFYFHNDLAGLRRFRDAQQLSESVENRADGSVYFRASRDDAHGVRVVAWTLITPQAPAVAA